MKPNVKAKIGFPEVFEVSPAQSAKPQRLKRRKLKRDAIKDAAEGRRGGSVIEEEDEVRMIEKGKGRALCMDIV
jgi:hypothetical protein